MRCRLGSIGAWHAVSEGETAWVAIWEFDGRAAARVPGWDVQTHVWAIES